MGEVVGTAVGVVLGASLATGSTSLAGFRGGAQGELSRRRTGRVRETGVETGLRLAACPAWADLGA